MTAPMTLWEFEREAEYEDGRLHKALTAFWYANRAPAREDAYAVVQALRPALLRLLAGERERIIAALPGGNICDPQEIADMIRTMGDQT